MSLREKFLGSRSRKIASTSILIGTLIPFLVYAQTVTKILGRDGTNIADVTPANTTPTASEKALVVTISPNSPSPAGSQDVNLIKVGGSAIAIGQAAMAASMPVVIASNQSAIAITSATLATEATLSSLNSKFGTLGQKTMAGSAPVVIASDQSPIPISGTITVTSVTANQGTPNTIGNSWPMEVTDGTNILGTSLHPLRIDPTGSTTQPISGTVTANQGGAPWSVSGSGNFTVIQPTASNLNASVVGTGIAGTPAGGVLSVQGVSGGQALPISGTVTVTPSGTQNVNLTQVGSSAISLGQTLMTSSVPVTIASNQSVLSVTGTSSDNSTNSTTKISTLPSRANASSPSWTEGNQVPMSVDLTGNLRTVDSAAVTTNAPTYTNGQTSPLSLTTGGALRVSAIGTQVNPSTINVTARDVASTTTTGQYNQTIVTGTPTANSAATFALAGVNTVRVEITGVWTGTLTSELTLDGIEWHPIGVHLTGSPISTSSFTTNGGGNLNVAGALNYRMRATAAWTGTATITVTEAAGVSTIYLANAITIRDSAAGSSTQNTIKAASTAPVATDTSMVVVESPNSPLLLAQNSATSGQVGPMCQGATTTAAPTYTTGRTNPLSLTTTGALRVDASGSTQPVSGTVTANQGGAPWTVTGTGSAGTAATGVLTVQGITSMTPIQVSQATASNLNATVVGTASDNSANSTAKLPVIGARANAAAPSFTEGNQAPLSIDLGGLLRTYMGSWLGSTAPTVGQKANASSIPVTLSSDQVGSAGTAAAGVQTIQGITSMTPVQVSQATASSLNATVVQSTASNLNAQVVGAAANGAAVTGNPLLCGGSDGTNARSLKTDSSGNMQVIGTVANGALVSGNPVQIAGSDGTSVRAIKTDTSGDLIVIGGGTAGSPSGGVMTVQGSTSMTALTVGGPVTNGSAVSGNPVITAGYDGTSVRILRTDATGRPAGSSYFNCTTNETRTLKSGSGVLRGIYVGNAGTSSAVDVYDNTAGSGTKIISVATTVIGISLPVNAAFATGLTYTTAGSVAANIAFIYD